MPDLQNPAIRMEAYQQAQLVEAAQNFKLWELGILALSTSEIQQGQANKQQALAVAAISQSIEPASLPLGFAPERVLSTV